MGPPGVPGSRGFGGTNTGKDVPMSVDNETLAEDADLVYVPSEAPGIRRVRRGKGFSYHHPNGKKVGEPIRNRIQDLVIPPAWEDVWVSADPRGHIQATGRDDAGRKQYIYHEEWVRARDEAKFDRLGDFGMALPHLRCTVTEHLRMRGLPKQRVVALVVALLDTTLIRVGNTQYAMDNDTFGLTTLRAEHVDIEETRITFGFSGKGGTSQEVALDDRRLTALVAACDELGGQHLFSYDSDEGQGHVESDDVNEYLADTTQSDFTAKDFRTWGGSAVATAVLGPLSPPESQGEQHNSVIDAIDEAAEALGNTRAVCRAAYVHPSVLEAFESGSLHDVWSSSRRSKSMAREERTLVKLLTSG